MVLTAALVNVFDATETYAAKWLRCKLRYVLYNKKENQKNDVDHTSNKSTKPTNQNWQVSLIKLCLKNITAY